MAELTAKLFQRGAQLKAVSRELEAFSYSVSHDLRSPLRALHGFSQALLDDHAEQFDGEARGYLGRIRAANQRMGHMIDDLLRLSKVTRVSMTGQPIDLSGMAAAVIAGLRKAEAGGDVLVMIAPSLMADSDPDLVRVALTNPEEHMEVHWPHRRGA